MPHRESSGSATRPRCCSKSEHFSRRRGRVPSTIDTVFKPQLKEQRLSPTMPSGPAWSQKLRDEIGKAVIGQDTAVERLLVALLAGGHVLLEGMPGLAKTLLVKSRSE